MGLGRLEAFLIQVKTEQSGVAPSNSSIRKLLEKDELARHCRWRTGGTSRTTELLENLFASMRNATDVLGVLLMSSELDSIWQEQKRRV